MKKNAAQRGRPALDVIEDAVHLLRTAPASGLLIYYTGAIPFALGLLHFWADMSRGAYAERRCPAAALGMTLLFLWLKCWQAVFTSVLRTRLEGGTPSKWGFRRVVRLIFIQGIAQPSRLLALPVALACTIPFGWVSAFYENITVLGDGIESGVRPVLRRAAAQARLWQGQNHMLLLLLAMAAMVVWFNALIAVAAIPSLLKEFLGIESAFSRAGMWAFLNTTFLAATVTLAWLALDPLVKAVYVLRCFHGEARKDGADLLAELIAVRANGRAIAVAALVLFTLLAPVERAPGETNLPPAKIEAAATVPPAQIDKAVKETLQRDKYAWRLPREETNKDDSTANQGWFQSFLASINDMLGRWMSAVGDFFRNILEWFARHLRYQHKPSGYENSPNTDWSGLLHWLAYTLLAVAGVALLMLGIRLWRQGWRRSEFLRAEVISAQPDLNDENLTAAQLPEDGWLKLAREMLEKGDLRLALRAFYLATLAHLAAREILSIARFKSNRDYENEVNRRARGSAELRAAFSANVSSFDRAWYGLYDVTADALAQFQSNFERIRSC